MDEAKRYAEYRRNILPKSYRENAFNRQKKPNHPITIMDDGDEKDNNASIADNAEKVALQQEIQEKIMAMHDQYVDLNDSDIEEFQALLYEDSDDDDSYVEWADETNELPRPIHEVKIEPLESLAENAATVGTILKPIFKCKIFHSIAFITLTSRQRSVAMMQALLISTLTSQKMFRHVIPWKKSNPLSARC